MRSASSILRNFAWSVLLAGAVAQAATVSGVVTDKTTSKPAAGDTVVLLEPMSGMSEVGRATTDGKGHYSLTLPNGPAYLVRVTHQGADYFIAAPQGGGTGDISVYDVAASVNGVTISEHVTGIETDNGQLRVVERYDIHNGSNTTQWSKKSFEVVLPEDAVLGDVSAQRPGVGSLPTSLKLDPAGQKGHYGFNFPIQPDEGGKGTLFQVQYQLPYGSSKYTFHSVVTLHAQTTWVVLPKSMTLTPGSGTDFQLSPQDPSVQTYLSRDTDPGKPLEFTIAGTGSFPREDQGSQADGNQAAPAAGGGPGGGIGEPINTPDPLSKYKWWILGGLGLLFAAVAAFLLRRPVPAVAPVATVSAATSVSSRAVAAHAPPAAAAVPVSHEASLLAVLKEEMFALESDKIAGTISSAEYAEQKSALETLLKRALRKS